MWLAIKSIGKQRKLWLTLTLQFETMERIILFYVKGGWIFNARGMNEEDCLPWPGHKLKGVKWCYFHHLKQYHKGDSNGEDVSGVMTWFSFLFIQANKYTI